MKMGSVGEHASPDGHAGPFTVGTLPIFLTMSSPLVTLPKIVYFPFVEGFRLGVAASVTKNWLPFPP